MAEAAYLLCALTSLACALMLGRGYLQSRAPILLWSGACFAFLTLNNMLLFLDKVIFPDDVLVFAGVSVLLWRTAAALAGIGLLLFGLLWDAE